MLEGEAGTRASTSNHWTKERIMRLLRILFENEAAMAVAALLAALNALAAFGVVELSADQVAGLNGVLIVGGGLLTRFFVWSEAGHEADVARAQELTASAIRRRNQEATPPHFGE